MTGALLLFQVLSAMPDAALLRARAESAGVPALAALAVAYTESRSNVTPGLRGADLEWGRFQIKRATASRRCPGLDVTTYAGNVACFYKMFAEDIGLYGVERALCVHNTGRPHKTCPYARDVLVLWKREELAGVASVAKDGTAVQQLRRPAPPPSPKRGMP